MLLIRVLRSDPIEYSPVHVPRSLVFRLESLSEKPMTETDGASYSGDDDRLTGSEFIDESF